MPAERRFNDWELLCGRLPNPSSSSGSPNSAPSSSSLFAPTPGKTSQVAPLASPAPGRSGSAPEEQSASSPCELVQRLAVKDSGQTVFLFTSLRSSKGDGLVGIISVPTGGYLAPGMEMRIDDRRPFKLLYETCNPAGCHAGFPLAGRVLADLSTGKAATVRVWSTKTNSVDVRISLNGFARGLSALRASPR